jgi:hypothetical protein
VTRATYAGYASIATRALLANDVSLMPVELIDLRTFATPLLPGRV